MKPKKPIRHVALRRVLEPGEGLPQPTENLRIRPPVTIEQIQQNARDVDAVESDDQKPDQTGQQSTPTP